MMGEGQLRQKLRKRWIKRWFERIQNFYFSFFSLLPLLLEPHLPVLLWHLVLMQCYDGFKRLAHELALNEDNLSIYYGLSRLKTVDEERNDLNEI